jgi:hypothetical protein
MSEMIDCFVSEEALVKVPEPSPKAFEIRTLDRDIEAMPRPDMPYYVIAKEGVFLYKTTSLGDTIVPFDDMFKHLPSLGKGIEKGCFWWGAPKIPAAIMAKTIKFFTEVYKRQATEVEVVILYNDVSKHFFLAVPEQECSGASVKSKTDTIKLHRGWAMIGTIHSHCDFGAFHSGTDDSDADKINGIHITIGDLITGTRSYATMVAINGTKFHYDPPVVVDLENMPDFDSIRIPEWWYDRVKKQSYTSVTNYNNRSTFVSGRGWEGSPNNVDWSKYGSEDWDSYDGSLLPTSSHAAYYGNSVWVDSLKCSVPRSLYDSQHFKLKDDAWEAAIKIAMSRLEKVAQEHQVLLVWDTMDYSDPEVPDSIKAEDASNIMDNVEDRKAEAVNILAALDDMDDDEMDVMAGQMAVSQYLHPEDLVDSTYDYVGD